MDGWADSHQSAAPKRKPHGAKATRVDRQAAKKEARRERTNDGAVGTVKAVSDAIMADEHFAQDAGGKLYRFIGGVYRSKAESFVRHEVKALAKSGRERQSGVLGWQMRWWVTPRRCTELWDRTCCASCLRTSRRNR